MENKPNPNLDNILDYGVDPTKNLTVASKTVNGPSEARILLFSDDPEYVPGPGIMYQDLVMGRFRVFAYHVNNTQESLYFSVVMTNLNAFPVTVSITKKAAGGPSADYTAVGKMTVGKWLQSKSEDYILLPPGQSVFLDSRQMPRTAGNSELVHYLYDGYATGPILVSVVARTDRIPTFVGLPLHPSSRTGKPPMRGTFPVSEYNATYTADLSGYGQYAKGVASKDEYLSGWSAVDGQSAVNYGNFGILYHTRLQILPSLTNQAAVVLNPRGGIFATWVRLKVADSFFIVDSDPFPVPASQTSLGNNTTHQGVLLYADLFLQGVAKSIEILWMPAGGTNLPIDFLIMNQSTTG